MKKLSMFRSPLFWMGLVWTVALVVVWSSQVAWATPDQLPARQTVPTRVKTAVPPPPPPPATQPSTQSDSGSRSTQPTAAPTATITFTPTTAPAMATAKENLRIRSGPGTTASLLGTLTKGATAPVVGRTSANDWWQIIVPSDPNTRGWISAAFATINGSIETLPIVQSALPTPVPATPTTTIPPPTATILPTATPVPPTLSVIPTITSAPSPLAAVVTPMPVVQSTPLSSSGGSLDSVVPTIMLVMGAVLVVIAVISAAILLRR